jgi:hypothetical protein
MENSLYPKGGEQSRSSMSRQSVVREESHFYFKYYTHGARLIVVLFIEIE